MRRSRPAALAVLLALALAGAALAQARAAGAPYSLLSQEGRRPVSTRVVGGQEMFALDELARLFGFTVQEDALAGGLTVSAPKQTIVLTPGQPLVSVGGRLISLPASPVRDGGTWLVPVDFVSRALAPSLDTPLELRKPSRLILLGDIRVPRVAGAIDVQGRAARLRLDVAPGTPHTVSRDEGRLLIRFEADALDATLPATTVPDLIQAVRPSDGAAVLVVDLGPRFSTFRTSEVPGDRGAVRILIDILPEAIEAEPDTPVEPPALDPAPPPLLDLVPPGAIRTVVIDPGHGGDEHGARGPNGAAEKDITLSVARRLKASLEARLGVRVILTREADQTVGLDQRAAVANNNKADLFISLHANSSVRPSVSGAEVFYLNLAEYGDQAERMSRGGSEPLPVFGGGSRDIEVILWEMAQARYIEDSAAFAEAVEAALRARVPMSPRALQQAPFRVLVGANMPAVLVELGFISNPEQERQLTSDAFQQSLVQALVDSVVRFRDARSAQQTGDAAARPGGPGGSR